MPDAPSHRPPRYRLDLHNHTHHSSDGRLDPRRLLELAAARGIHVLAVTDHGTVRGGLECAALAAADERLPRVIPGQEVMTGAGEVIGLYLERDLPSGLALRPTVELIRRQGGLVYLPHPFDSIRRGTVAPGLRAEAADLADIIEARNGRMLMPAFNRRALALASDLGKPLGAGSDAHFAAEVGRAYVEVEALPTRETLLELVRGGRLGRPPSFWRESQAWLYFVLTTVGKIGQRLREVRRQPR